MSPTDRGRKDDCCVMQLVGSGISLSSLRVSDALLDLLHFFPLGRLLALYWSLECEIGESGRLMQCLIVLKLDLHPPPIPH